MSVFEYFPQPVNGPIIIEGIIVGLLLIIFTYIAASIVHFMGLKPVLPSICDSWNKNYVMEVTLFLSGFLFHIFFEISGFNKKYVIAKKDTL